MLPNAMLPKVIFRKKKQPNNEKHNSRMHIILFSQGSKDGSFQGQSLSPSSQGSQVKRQSVLQHEGGQPTVFPPRCSYADILQVKWRPVARGCRVLLEPVSPACPRHPPISMEGAPLPLVALWKFPEGPSSRSGVAQCLLWPCKLGTGAFLPRCFCQVG